MGQLASGISGLTGLMGGGANAGDFSGLLTGGGGGDGSGGGGDTGSAGFDFSGSGLGGDLAPFLFDPTGGTAATTAITGSPTGATSPAGPQDVGGTQSDPQQPQQQQQQPSPHATAFAPVEGPLADLVKRMWTPQYGQQSPFQPGGDPTQQGGPAGFVKDQSRVPGQQRNDVPPYVADALQFPPGQIDPSSNQLKPATPQQQGPQQESGGGDKQTASQGPQIESGGGGDDSGEPTLPAASAPASGQQQAAGGVPDQRGMGAMGGGMPGGVGNIVRDIMGLMSGNPMSLMSLLQDITGMGGGMQGKAGMPGGMMPGMFPGMRGGMMMPGMFPGMRGRFPGMMRGRMMPGMFPGMRPGMMPGMFPGMRPGMRPGMMPGQPMSRQPGQAATPSGGAAAQPAPGLPPAASQPLNRSDINVPQWSRAGQGNGPPMRPSQGSVDRSRFRSENNDQTAYRAAWMVNGEVGLNRPTRQQIVQLETAFNRAQYRNHSLARALLPQTRYGDAGYYDGLSPHPTYRISARPTPEQFAKFKREVWDPVMRGSNLSDVGWGPMTGNASAGVARNQYARGTQGYTMGSGESYFREGPFRAQLPTVGGQQQEMVAAE